MKCHTLRRRVEDDKEDEKKEAEGVGNLYSVRGASVVQIARCTLCIMSRSCGNGFPPAACKAVIRGAMTEYWTC